MQNAIIAMHAYNTYVYVKMIYWFFGLVYFWVQIKPKLNQKTSFRKKEK